MLKKKLILVAVFIFAVLLMCLILYMKLSTKKYCMNIQKCIHISREWAEVKIMRGEKSMIFLRRGFFGGVDSESNQMDIYFLDENEGRINEEGLKTSEELKFSYGSAYKISTRAPVLKNAELSNFFAGAAYIPNHFVIIKCSDFHCLEYIKDFSIN
jgi:hypothetical protein